MLYEVGDALREVQEMPLAKTNLVKSLDIAEKKGFDRLQLDCKTSLGFLFYWISEYQSAHSYFHSALRDHPNIITAKDSSLIFTQMGQSYYYMGDLSRAYDYRLQAVNISENMGDSVSIAYGLYTLGEMKMALEDYDGAIEKIEESLQISERLQLWKNIGYCYDLLGRIYFDEGDYNTAMEYIVKSCEPKYNDINPYNEAYCAYMTARCYLEMGEYDQARPLFQKALEMQIEMGLKEEIIYTKMYMSLLGTIVGDCQSSIKTMMEGLKEAKERNAQPVVRDAYDFLAEGHEHCSNFKKAYLFKKKYYELKDSIIGQSILQNIASLSSNFELKQQKQEIAILQKNKEVSLLYKSLMSSVIVLLLLTILFVYFLWKKQYNYNSLLRKKNKEIKRHFKELQNTNKKLEEANKDLEQFAYISSHDLKAPLRTIGSYTSLIKRRYAKNLDQEGIEFLDFVTDDVKHMNTLLEDILTYSKVNRNGVDFDTIDLNAVLEQVLRILRPTIENAGASVEYHTLPNILGNATQLFQVFQNMIDNAIKFVPAGRAPNIHISHQENDGEHCILVSDNGIGIPKDFQKKVFSLFKRLHTKADYNGTGVGLSICKKIIEKHGGKIWVESDGVSGSTFCFTLKKGHAAPTLPNQPTPVRAYQSVKAEEV